MISLIDSISVSFFTSYYCLYFPFILFYESAVLHVFSTRDSASCEVYFHPAAGMTWQIS